VSNRPSVAATLAANSEHCSAPGEPPAEVSYETTNRGIVRPTSRRGHAAHVRSGTQKYYRDVYDHLVQHVELVETYRDLASGARDIYLNTLSQSTNEVMKRLTVVATIILPLTFVVGVYGMNFGGGPYNMPELGWRFGYPAVMMGMGLIAAVMLGYFRSSGWL